MAIEIKGTDKLKKYLELRGLSQRDFAELLGVDESYVSQIMNGRRPSWNVMRKIFVMTGFQANDLFVFTYNKGKGANKA